MAKDTHIYGAVNSKTNLKEIFRAEAIGTDADYDEKWGD